MERTKQGQRTLHYRVCLALTAGMVSIMPVTQALPQQGSYDNSAAATIAATADTMNIAGKADNNVLNWLAFSIAKGETVNFDSKNYLNIVNGTTASEIYGALNGAGSIYLVNPNGILFGSTAQVNVGNLIASTRPLSELDTAGFTANGTSPILNHVTDAGRVTGDIVNMGRLQAKSVIIEGNAVSFQNTADITSDGTSKLTGTNVSIQAKDEVHVGYEASGVTNRTFYEDGAARTVAVHDYANDTAAASASTLGYTVNDLAGTAKTPVDYLLVDNVYDLQNMDSRLAGSYMLAGDIDAAATGKWSDSASYGLEGFKPVGTWVDYSTSKPFTGRLDGMNHNIRGLIINRTCTEDADSYIGLFGYAKGSILENVRLSDGSVTVKGAPYDTWIGSLVGDLEDGGIIRNVSNTNEVSSLVNTQDTNNAGFYIGGIAGGISGNIENVQNSGRVKHVGTIMEDLVKIGGIAGRGGNSVEMSNVSNTGEIISDIRTANALAEDHTAIGGIIGSGTDDDKISNAYNAGNITAYSDGGRSNISLGGIAGEFGDEDSPGASITSAYNTGNLSGTIGKSGSDNAISGLSIGGIAGNTVAGSLERIYNTGDLRGSVQSGRLLLMGGIVGDNSDVNVENCSIQLAYNTGNILAQAELHEVMTDDEYDVSDLSGACIGGISGFSGEGGMIQNVYNAGNIRLELTYSGSADRLLTGIGGISGLNGGGISNVYNTGSVQATVVSAPAYVGGVIGNNLVGTMVDGDVWQNNGSISQAVYANDIAGTAAAAIGQNTGTVSNVTGRTLAGMKQAAAYMDWDIAATGSAGKTWRIYEGNTTPLLTCFLQGPVTVSGLSDQTAAVTEGAQHGDISGAVYTPALSAEQISGHVFAGGGSAAGTYSLLYSDQLGYDLVNSNTYTLQGTAAPEPTPTPTPTPTSLTSALTLPLILPSTTYQNYQEIKGKVRPVVDSPSLAVGYRSDYDILQSVSGGIKLPTEAGILHTTAQPQGSTVVVTAE